MKRRGLTPADIRTADDLAKLPIVEKSSLQKDPEYFLSRAVRREDCLALRSSGSSGAPKTIWHDPAAIFQNAAHGERDRAAIMKKIGSWTGYRETVIVAPIDASQLAVQSFVRSHENLKVLGSRHCFNSIADGRHNLLSLKPMHEMVSIDPVARIVTVDAGITYGQLCPQLRDGRDSRGQLVAKAVEGVTARHRRRVQLEDRTHMQWL